MNLEAPGSKSSKYAILREDLQGGSRNDSSLRLDPIIGSQQVSLARENFTDIQEPVLNENGGWKSDSCDFLSRPEICLLICCCEYQGLACVQYSALEAIRSENPAPIVGCCATFCFGPFGAAWNRQAIRAKKNLPMESYWYDFGSYVGGHLCCMGIQELVEVS